MTSITDPVGAPPRANDGRDVFIAGLEREAKRHPALRHAWLHAVAESRFPNMYGVFVNFARTYHGYSCWFPRYLQAVIDRLESPAHRELLEVNLAEEKGELHDDDREAIAAIGIDPASVDGVPHPALFRRFCRALGVPASELRCPPAVAMQWRARFRDFLATASPAAAVGALGLGTESVVEHIYRHILAGIRSVPGLKRSDWVFFELHCYVDDQHQKDLLQVAGDLATTKRGRSDLRQGMLHALDLRLEVWDSLYAEATRRGEVA